MAIMNMQRHRLADLGIFDPNLCVHVDDADGRAEENEIRFELGHRPA